MIPIVVCTFAILLATPACSQTQDLKSVSLSQLKPEDSKGSGALLMRLVDGLHPLTSSLKDRQSDRPRFVMVHGYRSRGYEWVYATTRLAEYGEVYFYRWDWNQCPDQGGVGLLAMIDKLAQRDPQRPIEVWGHSYGGVIAAVAASRYQNLAPLSAHIIAAPVAGHPKLEGACSPSIKMLTQTLYSDDMSAKEHRFKVHQWRTQHHLDGAFKNLKIDPQVVSWRGEVTRLPPHYRGRRLGHNWSISWVTDKRYPPRSP